MSNRGSTQGTLIWQWVETMSRTFPALVLAEIESGLRHSALGSPPNQ